MSPVLRASLLMLVLFIESLGSAWALPPGIPQPPSAAEAAMPCHDQIEQQATMPCCDEQGRCCGADCLGVVNALAPGLSGIGVTGHGTPQADARPPGLSRAHLLRLLRPPASVES